MLQSLEIARLRLQDLFPRPVDDMTVVLHRSVSSLTMTNPLLPLRLGR